MAVQRSRFKVQVQAGPDVWGTVRATALGRRDVVVIAMLALAAVVALAIGAEILLGVESID
jgi:hypothetical protein